MKSFECTVKTLSGNTLKAYFENGKVMLEGAGKKVPALYANKFSKTVTILAGDKELKVGLESGATHLEAMLNTFTKPNRELFIVSEDFKAANFGSQFESVESQNDRILCAYKYSA